MNVHEGRFLQGRDRSTCEGPCRWHAKSPDVLRPAINALLRRTALLAVILAAGASDVFAETYPRISAAEGTVVARKSGEEAQFVDLSAWRPVDVNQDLLAGDTLRTNAAGNLTIRFADKSLVRMGRNTTMLVKKISSTSDSVLSVTEGSIWARAVRGGSRIQVDTPAATAAIRGTDWTMRVNGAQTTLTVLEGAVELSNAQGSVVVTQGEGASVTIGQAPRKYTLVNLKEREQILLYSEIRGVFSGMSTTGIDGPRTRAERRRVLAVDASARSAEDWLSLAETSLDIAGRDEARAALARLKRPLPGVLEARAKLIEAMLAGQQMQYARAADLFKQALPGLPRNRKAAATYGLWFARSLAEPDRALPPPSPMAFPDDPEAVLLWADVVAHQDGTAAAIAVIAEGEKRFPNDARLPAARAAMAFELDRRDEVREALARAKALDPDNPSHLLTSAQFRTTVSSDVDGALAELEHAAAVAPGSDAIWNEIGLVQAERNAIVEADRAHRKAVALNPENPAVLTNYARFLMDNEQMSAAKRLIDIAVAIDPTSYAVLAAKGRYLLKMGKTAEGEKALLDAAAVNPTYGDALIGLAIASYQQYAVEETAQALDNADRFDPLNPSIPLIRSGVALDQFEADEAIIQAREALRRRLLRGGYYTGYDVNKQAASQLAISLENLGLDEWGQYYSDRAYDPFKAFTYFDEAANGRLTPFINPSISGLDRFPVGGTASASELQGMLIDPMIAMQTRRNSLEGRAFTEVTASGALLREGPRTGWGSDITLQGTSYTGLPVSYRLEGSIARPESERENDADDFTIGGITLGLRPTLNDSVVLFGNRFRWEQGIPGQTSDPSKMDQIATESNTLGAAWSHIVGERNTIQAFVVRGDSEDHQLLRNRNEYGVLYDYDQYFSNQYWTGGFSHIFGVGPVTIRYGLEASQLESRFDQFDTNVKYGYVEASTSSADNLFANRTYVDATWDISRDLKFQAGAHYVGTEDADTEWGPIDPRLGGAWSPFDGHWLRAYYRQDTQLASEYTLAPISTVGLAPMSLPQVSFGQTQTAALRWDAEWNERFFTSVEYQHQKFTGLGLMYDDTSASADTSNGTIDRFNIAGNYWIGGGFGAFGSLTLNESRDTRGLYKGNDVPLIPDYVAQVGLRYVHPSRITATVAQNFVGRRLGIQDYYVENDIVHPLLRDLGRFTTTDAAIAWKSPNGSLEAVFSVTNIFDERFESAYHIPAPGRTIWAGLTARY